MDNEVPFVVKDHNSKTAIVYKIGRKFIYLIPMKSGKLTVLKLTESQYKHRQYAVLDTPIGSAILSYIRHSGGHTLTARQALESIMEGYW